MKDKEDFFQQLGQIDGQPLEQYEDLIGTFEFPRYVLRMARVDVRENRRSLITVRIPQPVASFPPSLLDTPVRRTALEDYLARRLREAIDASARPDETGVSRRFLDTLTPGPAVLPRTSVTVSADLVEARIALRLPARDGRVDGAGAQHVFFHDLPRVVGESLLYCNLPEGEPEAAVATLEVSDHLRKLLPTRGWVGFVAEGTRLDAGATLSVDTAAQDVVEVPGGEALTGLGIPEGLTVVLSETTASRRALLRALAAGVYGQGPTSGGTQVVASPDTVYLASERGRAVQKVDLSVFRDQAASVSLPAADGFSAQAASFMEYLEVGARVFVIEEADSDPTFLARDSRLNHLTGGTGVVRPLARIARQLVDELGLSLVVGGSAGVAEYLPVADRVLALDASGRIRDVTGEAKGIAIDVVAEPIPAGELARVADRSRWVVPGSLDASVGPRDPVVEADGHALRFGTTQVALDGLPQIAEPAQTESVGLILVDARERFLQEGRPVRELCDLIDRHLVADGLDAFTPELEGDLVRPRRYEIAAILNRLPGMRISHLS